jgi:tryptophanyl-tRNA synthetase
MKEISETGYWNGETAHIHHVHSKELSEWICDFLKEDKNKITYDFGCGLGNYLKDLQEKGFSNLIGYEADPSKKKVFEPIISKDLTIPFVLPIGGNVISLEVGEHIPKKYQDIYLDNITNNCNNYLITSWAIRGQAGFGHVNCLDNHEIIPEIEKRGFKYLEKESMSARSIIKDNAAWFRNTILIFKKEQSDATHTNNTI